MAKYRCSVCDYIHDEEKTGQKWDDLPEEWVCPVCESPKSYFVKKALALYLDEYQDYETALARRVCQVQ